MRADREPPAEPDFGRSVLGTATRVLGLVILLGGLFIVLKVVSLAWELLENQALISRISQSIEAEMHLNDFLHELVASRIAAGAQGGLGDNGQNQAVLAKLKAVDLVFIIAWMLTVVLLSILAKVGMRMVQAGGTLAVYHEWDVRQTRRLLRELGESLRSTRV